MSKLPNEHSALEHEWQGLYSIDSDRKMWRAVLRLLADDALREGIAARGHERALRNNLFNEPMLAAVIERAVRAFEERR